MAQDALSEFKESEAFESGIDFVGSCKFITVYCMACEAIRKFEIPEGTRYWREPVDWHQCTWPESNQPS